MKRLGLVLAGLSLALVGLLPVPVAKADTTSIDRTSGTVNGTFRGTVDLPFVSPGVTDSGAADSLVLTSIPAGFGTLAEDDVVSSWADPTDRRLHRYQWYHQALCIHGRDTRGEITVGDYFNSTDGSAGTFGGWICPAGGYNVNGLSGVTFTPTSTSAVPEPGTSTLMLIGLGLLGLTTVMRKRNSAGHQLAT